jgi:hypothetical protein
MSPHYYVRFKWNKAADLKQLRLTYNNTFTIETIPQPEKLGDLSMHTEMRDQLRVTADTLKALLSTHRVCSSRGKLCLSPVATFYLGRSG